MKTKNVLILILSLCLMLSFAACGTVENTAASATLSPTAAPVPSEESAPGEEEIFAAAQNALDELHSLGILSEKIVLDPDAVGYFAFNEAGKNPVNGYEGRVLPAYYNLTCKSIDGIFVSLSIDADTGKALSCNVEAKTREGDEKLDKPAIEFDGKELEYHDSLYRITDGEMTLDELCELLRDYWGFTGYTLSGTKDDFYSYDTDAPSGEATLREIMDEPYITVYFDGDAEGCPMYIEGVYFPENTHFSFGYGHLVG